MAVLSGEVLGSLPFLRLDAQDLQADVKDCLSDALQLE